MVHEWSKEKDDKLFANRNDVIELKDKDAGYEWKKINDKPGKILTLDPRKQRTLKILFVEQSKNFGLFLQVKLRRKI